MDDAWSGILHQEMPKGDEQSRMHGCPAWAKLALIAEDDRPAGISDIPASAIPEATDDDGTRVRVICGEFCG